MPKTTIRPIASADALAVRQPVLRPHLPLAASVYPVDDLPDTWHVGAFQDGALVGVATIFPEAAPGGPEAGAWRLRGMATLPEARGTGLGGRLLTACIDHVASQGGSVLWCNARTPAVGFYERYGFACEGDEFDLPGIGPHYVMRRPIGDDEAG